MSAAQAASRTGRATRDVLIESFIISSLSGGSTASGGGGSANATNLMSLLIPIGRISGNENSSGTMGSFRTLDRAVRDFATRFNPVSISNNWEYGTYFYSWTEMIVMNLVYGGRRTLVSYRRTRFSYTVPHSDRQRSTVSMSIANPPIPEGTTWVASEHTHGAWQNRSVINGVDMNDRFSPEDKAHGQMIRLPFFLVAPNGSIRVYDSSTLFGRDNQIARPWSMPFDPRHPDVPRWRR